MTILIVLLLLAGSLPAVSGQYRARAQDSGSDLGSPPVADEFSPGSADSGSIDLAAIPTSVDLTSREASRAFYNTHFIQDFPGSDWTGNSQTCDAGTSSAAYKQAVLDQLGWYRVMAGLPGNVGLSPEWTDKAQQAALMMYLHWTLSHNPDPSWACYTEDGAEAAGSSNLAYGASDPVSMYIEDPGVNNGPVGHRRWLLLPQLTTVGIGGVWSYNVLWVTDNYYNPRPATRDGFVAWPPPGYVPYQVVYPRWSFSYPRANFSGATVSIKKNGSTVAAPIEDRTSVGYGDNTIVFGVGGASWNQPSSDLHYVITISNVIIDGAPASFTYEVVVFDPARAGSGTLTSATVSQNEASPGEPVDYSLRKFPANSTVNITWKPTSGSTVSLGSVSTNASGDASGSFNVPAGPGGRSTVVFSSGSVSKEVPFTVTTSVTLLTPWVLPGGEVDLRITGLRANEDIYIELEDEHGYAGQTWWFTADANGTATPTLVVTPWPGAGRYDVVVYDDSWKETRVPGLVLILEPPNAVTAGSVNLQATSLMTTVALDASGSTGADGAEIASYDWSIGETTIATGRNATAQLPVGVHNVALTITDVYGLTDTATLTVTITAAPQSAIANAGPDQFVASSGGTGSVTLDGSGSVAAPGTTITEYKWTRTGQPTPLAFGVTPTVSLPIGTHEITLTVTTNFNTTSTDVVTVVVGAPPTANAGPDLSLDTFGNSVTLTLDGSGSSAGAGSTITGYQWTGLPGGTRTGVSPSVSLPVGTHTATLTVTASNGMTATDTVSITVVKLAAPTVTVTPTRAAPVATVEYTVNNFPRGSEVAITWTTNHGVTQSLGTLSFGSSNTATGSFQVPAGPGGLGNFVTFTLGTVSVSAEIDVAPRISPSATTVVPGQQITVNLRGFAPRDDVLLRWKVGNGWVNLGTTRTSSTGSVTNFPITVPLNADSGTIRVQGTLSQQTKAVTLMAPAVSITPVRTTVNNGITWNVTQFPPNSTVQITWRRLTGSTIDMGTAQTDASGAASGQFRVPATPGGAGQQITFSSGSVSKTVLFEVAPRVKVTPAPAERGETIDISLRGFARQEAIRIRWRMTGTSTWIVLAHGTTSNTGSANIRIPVPAYAADGTYQLRAETASFNQQTNVVEIEGGGQVVPAAEVVVTPEPTPDITTPTEIDRTALPLDAPLEIVAITDEQQTPDLKRPLTDGDLATGWSGTPDPVRGDARLTIDLGAPHSLSGFAWLTETGGCGTLTGLEHSLDGETWIAFDPAMQPGVIGEGMAWRYRAASVDARFIRFSFTPESPEQTSVGCLAEVAVWGTVIVIEETPAETPVATEVPSIESTPLPTVAPVEPTPEPTQPPAEPTPHSTVEPEPQEPEESTEG